MQGIMDVKIILHLMLNFIEPENLNHTFLDTSYIQID